MNTRKVVASTVTIGDMYRLLSRLHDWETNLGGFEAKVWRDLDAMLVNIADSDTTEESV